LDTVSDALEKYKDLKEVFRSYVTDVKDDNKNLIKSLEQIRDEIKSLVKEHADTKSEIRILSKELEWDRRERKGLINEIEQLKIIITKCPVCNGEMNIQKLWDFAKTASTKSTIAISLVIVLMVALISHFTLGKP